MLTGHFLLPHFFPIFPFSFFICFPIFVCTKEKANKTERKRRICCIQLAGQYGPGEHAQNAVRIRPAGTSQDRGERGRLQSEPSRNTDDAAGHELLHCLIVGPIGLRHSPVAGCGR